MKKEVTTPSGKKLEILNYEEWNDTRLLYAQLCTISTMQLLLVNRLLKRFSKHKLVMAQEQKPLINRTITLVQEAQKNLEKLDVIFSGLGKRGAKDFVLLNTLLSKEAYSMIRVILNWQNAINCGHDTEEIESYINSLSTGKKRLFTKKFIDTFMLEEDKK